MKLSDLTAVLTVTKQVGDDLDVRAIAYDSRNVRPGSVFVAIPGIVADGHDFLDQAVGLGAVAAVVQTWHPDLPIAQIQVDDSRQALASLANQFFDYPSRKLKLIGITGTNGKTTTAFLLESVFRRAGFKTAMIGTIEYRINGERLNAERTTPESLELQQMFASMVAQGVEVVVMEVSSHALDLRRVDGCHFAARVFTNLTQDHLDYHADIASYFSAKARLFSDSDFGPAISVVNGDDAYARRLCDITDCRVFGTEEADYKISDLRCTANGISYRISFLGGDLNIESPLLGEFNAWNSAAAVVTALELGAPTGAVIDGIADVARVPGRFEEVNSLGDFQVLVDYAHTPDGLEKVITAARDLAQGARIITVFGCGGDRDRGKRPMMGRIAAGLSDIAIVTSDNPRTEAPRAIIDNILAGIDQNDLIKTKVEVERELAIRAAINEARPGDVVLIAGKGHENYQLINEKAVPFDDRRIAERVLRELYA